MKLLNIFETKKEIKVERFEIDTWESWEVKAQRYDDLVESIRQAQLQEV